jgi:ATP-dependent Lon protease
MFVKSAVLFPKCTIPLRIFEPRYQEMLDSVLKSTRSFILSFEDGDNGNPKNSVGTMGLINSAVKQIDGTSIVMLDGLFKVRLNEINKTDTLHQNWFYEKLDISNSNMDFALLDKLRISYNRLCSAIDECDYPKNLPFSKNASFACDAIIEFIVSNLAFKKEFFLINNINKKLSLTLKVIESIIQKRNF